MSYNLTLRRESPVQSFLCTIVDTANMMMILDMYPGWSIVRLWKTADDEARHEILKSDPFWHVLSYDE